MPKIALRAYNREISSLIDRGQTDEAVAHCQYILQTYPKHLETYRLLGKAYLEAHRHTEAMDLFQRILAVVPDDFITHVGMSIIRGEEDDLNAAIWHMERAFESQPSNQAIQDELKHLYGRRDGQEPTKIRLTRGALCRMYARGNQNRQAIAEIKSILNETPDRPDLEVLLARMYFLSGMTPDALALSQKILEKLPFCYDTNKLMVEILSSSNKMSEADFYLKKVIALDPYESFVTDPNVSVDQVPEDLIQIDRYFYDPTGQGQPVEQVGQGEPTEETAPDWLVSDLAGVDDMGSKGFTRILDSAALTQEAPPEEDSTTTQPVVTEPAEENLPAWLQSTEVSKEEEIPDFLKSTGWATAGTITDETPPAQVINVDEPIMPPEGEIAPAEIPDWLQTMAPGGDSTSADEPVAQSGESFSDWLSGLDKTPSPAQEEPVTEPPVSEPKAAFSEPEPPLEAEPAGQLPDWLQQISTSQEPAITEEQGIWQKEEFQQEISTPQDSALPIDKPFTDEEFPIAGGTTILTPEDLPDWLQDMQPAAETTTKPDEPAEIIPTVEPPTYSPPQEVVTMALTPEEKESMPEWLAEIQQSIPIEDQKTETGVEPVDEKRTATLPDEDREEVEQMPDWLHLLDQDKPITEYEQAESISTDTFGYESVIPTTISMEPDTLSMEIPEDKPTTSILPPNPEDAAEELPEWLREMDTMPAEGTSPVELPAETPEEGFPDWLKGYNPPPAESPLPPEEPAIEQTPSDEVEVPAWLQDLTVGSSEVSSEPELPDWLNDLQIGAETGEEVGAISQSAELPEWLQDSVESKVEQVETALPDSTAETQEPVLAEAGLMESSQAEMEVEQPESISEEVPAIEEPVEQVEVSETLLTISDKVEEEGIPVGEEVALPEQVEPVEEAFAIAEPISDTAVVAEESLPELPELEVAEPVVSEQGEGEAEAAGSILADESAAAAAAAIGIPLFAENASKPGVTESLPPLTASQVPVEEEEPIPAEQAEQVPESEMPVEEAVSQVEVPAETEAMVSDALESIMLPEEPELTVAAEEVAETVSEEVIQPVEEFAPEVAEEEATPVQEPVSAIEEVVEPEPIAELEPEAAVEEEAVAPAEEVAPVSLEEETFLKSEEVAVSPEVLPEPDYDVLFTNAQRMVEAGDYSTAQPALSNLITSEQKLDDIIEVVQEALKRDPTDFDLWLTLGDAFGRSGKLQNALDAYTKAEEYLQ